ncbi:UNVERIFIED_CONTAM: Retrovirus-related Pol polyprotein from transposon RE1 [Sesamum indicum]
MNWVVAMSKELEALAANRTWILMTLSPGKCTIGSRWVYKLKLHPDGSIDRYKARLVAKDSTQIEGVDYFDSFSPVAKVVAIWIFLALAASNSWPLAQLDINNAFLHDFLEEDVYMDPLEGLLGFPAGQAHLDSLFTIKDLGLTKYFLGLKLAHSSHGLQITQHKYLQDILVDTSMLDARSFSTLLPPGLKLEQDAGSLLGDPDRFLLLVGRLLYFDFTRPDISFVVQ